MIRRLFTLSFWLTLILFLAACGEEAAPTPAAVATIPAEGETAVPLTTAAPETATSLPTPTPIPPSPTPSEPLAALVNDQPVFLSTYEKELARYEQAQEELGISVADAETDYRQIVFRALVERTLIAQAAADAGIQITPDMVDAQIADLIEASGGAANFTAWLEANQWTEEEFRTALANEMLTEEMVAIVTADVPRTAPQVHARYIQVDDAALAQSLLEQLEAGADFSFLANQNSLDRVTAQNGGDLGFFARGSLLVPAVEEAAFDLQPGEVSDVIPVTGEDGNTTYYLVQVIERDEQRPLTADLRYTLLQETFETWLDELWQQADIVQYINTDA